MAEQDPRDTSVPGERSEQDPAEGSRETVNESERMNQNESVEGGITNRPIEEEQREQQNLPPRGERKDGSHA